MPRRDDLDLDPRPRLRADRHRAGLRVRLLGHAGVQGPARGGLRRRPGQLQPRDDHDRPGVRRRHLHRAAHPRRRPGRHRAERPDALLADARRPDRAEPRRRAGRRGRARGLRRRAARRRPRGDPDRRGPPAVQGRRWPRSGSSRRARPTSRTSRRRPRRAAEVRLPGACSARRSPSAARAAASRTTPSSSTRHDPPGPVRLARRTRSWSRSRVLGWKEFELEVMRDRADNCVDRSARSRTSTRWASTPATRSPSRRPDALRPRVPAHARRVVRGAAPHRRRDRRLERPVRGRPATGRQSSSR